MPAQPGIERDPDCIFCKIAAGEISARKIYEDNEVIAFHDAAPLAPIHFMIVPKAHIASTAQLEPQHVPLMGRIMLLAPKLAREQGCAPYPDGGWRVAINTGKHGGQSVPHLHVHVMGGPQPWKWAAMPH